MITYLVSQNDFVVEINDKKYKLNKNNFLKLDELDRNIKLCDFNSPLNSIEINLNNNSENIYYKQIKIKDINLIEIISCGYENLKRKFPMTMGDVFLYDNCILIIYKNKPYTYYFKYDENCNFFEDSENIYVYNDIYCVKFNHSNKVFSHYFVKDFAKTQNGFDVLCGLPKNLKYSLLLSFNSNKKSVSVKKLKSIDSSENIDLTPYTVFYLGKNNFEEAKSYISDKIDINNLCQYLSKYENIYQIEDKWYLSGNDFTFFNFKIKNNLLFDID